MPHPELIILFARAPAPGRVKTRLIPRLGPEAAAGLQECMVRDTLETLGALGAEVELHTDAETTAWAEMRVRTALQAPGDLGARMLHALEGGLRAGYKKVMIAGSDSPTLPVTHLEQVLASAADVALGPCDDGGYYAIACRRTHRRMFAGVEWSTRRTLEQTVEAVRACGLSVALGPAWFDVDTEEGLARLVESPVLPRHTARFLEGLK